MRTYTPTAGDHITNACENACRAARAHNEPVEFSFNGIRLVAGPASTPDALANEYAHESEQRAEAYRASPEYAAQEARREAAEALNRSRDGEVRTFPLHAALTLVTGRVWASYMGAHSLAEHLLGEDPATLGMEDAMRAAILADYPDLATVTPEECPTSKEDAPERYAVQIRRFGETIIARRACVSREAQRVAMGTS